MCVCVCVCVYYVYIRSHGNMLRMRSHTRRTRGKSWINMCRFACRHIFGSCSACCLSVSRQILAMVFGQNTSTSPMLNLALTLILALYA